MKATVILYQLGVLLSTLLELAQPQERRGWQEDGCRRALREATSVKVETESPPRISGHWTSYQCETRPGPEYVLRKYMFRRHSFNAQVYYYLDEPCSTITHSITAKGTFRPARISWRTPGAYEAKYRLTQVVVIPYTKEKANVFDRVVNRYCKSSKSGGSLRPFRKLKIFQFTKYSKDKPDVDNSDFDCLKVFNFTMNELQLVRVERRHFGTTRRAENLVKAKGRMEAELLLGDISTNIKYRQQYRPTHFQVPLKKSKTPGCTACAIISKSNQWQPPTLEKGLVTTAEVAGDWVSSRCETRPNGQYLTRYLSFLSDGRSWSGEYDFYKDPLCQEPTFSLALKGNYFQEGISHVISTAKNYIFRTTKLKITPRDFQMVQYLNSYDGKQCGKAKAWNIGVTQDVTSSNGCVTLGIKLPNIEYEIMKADSVKDISFLYVGQRPSDFASLTARKNRPTSFQSPLTKCQTSYNDSSSYILPLTNSKNSAIREVSGPNRVPDDPVKSLKQQTLRPALSGLVSHKNLTMFLSATNTGMKGQSEFCITSCLLVLFIIVV